MGQNRELEQLESMTEETYKPRNSVVAAKEKLYDKTNLTVGQVDKFIMLCVGAIMLLVAGGVLL